MGTRMGFPVQQIQEKFVELCFSFLVIDCIKKNGSAHAIGGVEYVLN